MSEVTNQQQGSSHIYDPSNTGSVLPTPDTSTVDSKGGHHGHGGGEVKDTLQQDDTTYSNYTTYGTPENPSIPQPATTSQEVQQTVDNPNTSNVEGNTDAQTKQANPYLGVNFAAVMSSIMNLIAQINNEMGYTAAQQELKSRVQEVAMAQESASMTVASYNAQSQEQMNAAFADFSNAAIAGAQLIGTYVSASHATSQQNTDEENATNAEAKAKGELDTLNLQKTQAASDPDNVTAPKQEDVDEAQRNYDNAKEQTNKVKSNRLGGMQHHQQKSDQIVKLMGDMATGVVNGIRDTNNAALKGIEGSCEAAKQMIQGYQQALREYQENTNEAKKSAQQAIQSGLDAMTKIEDALTRFRSIFG